MSLVDDRCGSQRRHPAVRKLRSCVRSLVAASAKARVARPVLRRLVRCGVIPFERVSLFPFEERLVVGVTAGESFVYRGSSADMVARRLYWEGLTRWEHETMREFVPLARRARGFVDVGAYTGCYSLVSCTVNPHIVCVAFEPVPAVYDSLVANVIANRWQERVVTMRAALSTDVGTARFYLPSREMPDTGHLESSTRAPSEGGAWIDVPTTTLAATLPAGFALDLMKIDVEDAEGPVLHGMADVVAEHRPTIIVEMLASGSYREAVAVLDELGYTYYHLTEAGAQRRTKPAPAPGDRFMNFLCVPRR